MPQSNSIRPWPPSTRACLVLLLIALLLGMSTPNTRSEGEAAREYDIKAAFLYNFVKYVTLPPRPASGATITVGILGTDSSGGAFDYSINGKTVGGKTLVVRHLGEHGDPRAVNILFISASERERLRQIFAGLGNAGVLTVGESSGFAQSGGIINFITVDNRVRFEINPDVAARTGIRISSQLMRLAKIVHG